ncbi:glycosyltransferase 87 family protein [Streptomyces diastaticus]|uniref:Polyprenol-phosphate-mannose-dependent alpha-(1-2)-phosphatidylinositol mannoside mannosyltransferase n=1 Tax=Streptomyces griseus TaxID=1911 RepID=A0A380MPA8_STRGR|nr:glycosyltransferase 87 family protein [Streptomyces griseus]SUO93561.1 Polyprenol-phosphate-mannose-dependent alpha-(1-2)-phosphatidylinositol mannoside mannosyltransferase [Streptomyces griseus]
MLALSFTAFVALCLIQHIAMADTLVYRAEGRAVVNGSDLYGFTITEWELPATYPPFAAILFVPTTWLPIPALKVCFILGNTALLALLVHLSCRLAARPTRAPFLLLAVAVGIWLEPVFQTLLFGQINLAIVCLVVWDLTRPAGALGKGFALGVATGVKLTPGIFIVHLLLTGRVREGLTALASFSGTVLLGALVLPSATVDFFTRRLYETGRVGLAWIVDNQSLQGLIARALHTEHPGPAWAVPTAFVGLAGLWLARRLGGGGPWPVLVTAVTGLLVSPISWSHHWVWCVPLLVVLLTRGNRLLAAALTVLFLARPHWILPHQGDLDLHFPWWQQPLGAPYPVLGLGLLAAATWAAYGWRRYGDSGPRVPRQGGRGVGGGAGEPVGDRAG